MSDEARYGPYQVISDGDMSGNITSTVIIKVPIKNITYQVLWSGSSPVGVISVETSNDYKQNLDGTVKVAGSWSTLPFAVSGAYTTAIDLTGSSGVGTIEISFNSAYSIRLKYTRTSGTGTLQVYAHGME